MRLVRVSAVTTFGCVGSGWRAAVFLRLATTMPGRFRVTGAVTRMSRRGDEVTARHGVPTFRTTRELIAAEAPDFVVVSVPWAVARR